jgi:hypothetical protein
MPGTIVHQIRTAATTDSGAEYTIDASCSAPGTLPDASIFLVQVVTPSDPKDDAFLRLCSPADFAAYGTNRDQAAITDGIYRAVSYTFRYTSVAIANDAWGTLSGAINALVNEHDVFLTLFLTRPEGVDTFYPTIDQSEKTQRIATYQARIVDVATAEAERDEHQRTCRYPKTLELSTAQTNLAQASSDLARVKPVRSVVDVLAVGYPTAQATINTALIAAMTATSTSSATAPQQLAINSQLQAAQRSNDDIGSYDIRLIAEVQTPLAAFVGLLEARVIDLTSAVGAAQSELAACDLEMSRLQGDLDEARRARDAALAAVREVCTDFVPASDVDGVLAAAISLLLGGS